MAPFSTIIPVRVRARPKLPPRPSLLSSLRFLLRHRFKSVDCDGQIALKMMVMISILSKYIVALLKSMEKSTKTQYIIFVVQY